MDIRGSNSGSGLAATVAVIAVVLVSVALFFLVTRPAMENASSAVDGDDNGNKETNVPGDLAAIKPLQQDKVIVYPDPVESPE